MVILEFISKIIGTVLFTGLGMVVVLFTGAIVDTLSSKTATSKMFRSGRKAFYLILLLILIGMSSTCFISYIIYLIWTI